MNAYTAIPMAITKAIDSSAISAHNSNNGLKRQLPTINATIASVITTVNLNILSSFNNFIISFITFIFIIVIYKKYLITFIP